MTIDGEHDGLKEVERRLATSRPVPRAAFRGELRRQLLERAPAEQPRRVRLLIAAYATSGAFLLAIAVIGIAGVGPLSAG